MHPILRNVLALFLGLFIGGFVNYGLIILGNGIIPAPAGVDPSDINSINDNIHLYSFKHFIFLFLGHALGTLVGAFIAAKLAASHHMKFAIAVGLFFLLGGSMMAFQVTAPLGFEILDLVVAYIPMAWLGGKLGYKAE